MSTRLWEDELEDLWQQKLPQEIPPNSDLSNTPSSQDCKLFFAPQFLLAESLTLPVDSVYTLPSTDPADLLPLEILLYIFSWLTPHALCACARVSHQWKSLSSHDLLWKRFLPLFNAKVNLIRLSYEIPPPFPPLISPPCSQRPYPGRAMQHQIDRIKQREMIIQQISSRSYKQCFLDLCRLYSPPTDFLSLRFSCPVCGSHLRMLESSEGCHQAICISDYGNATQQRKDRDKILAALTKYALATLVSYQKFPVLPIVYVDEEAVLERFRETRIQSYKESWGEDFDYFGHLIQESEWEGLLYDSYYFPFPVRCTREEILDMIRTCLGCGFDIKLLTCGLCGSTHHDPSREQIIDSMYYMEESKAEIERIQSRQGDNWGKSPEEYKKSSMIIYSEEYDVEFSWPNNQKLLGIGEFVCKDCCNWCRNCGARFPKIDLLECEQPGCAFQSKLEKGEKKWKWCAACIFRCNAHGHYCCGLCIFKCPLCKQYMCMDQVGEEQKQLTNGTSEDGKLRPLRFSKCVSCVRGYPMPTRGRGRRLPTGRPISSRKWRKRKLFYHEKHAPHKKAKQ